MSTTETLTELKTLKTIRKNEKGYHDKGEGKPLPFLRGNKLTKPLLFLCRKYQVLCIRKKFEKLFITPNRFYNQVTK